MLTNAQSEIRIGNSNRCKLYLGNSDKALYQNRIEQITWHRKVKLEFYQYLYKNIAPATFVVRAI